MTPVRCDGDTGWLNAKIDRFHYVVARTQLHHADGWANRCKVVAAKIGDVGIFPIRGERDAKRAGKPRDGSDDAVRFPIDKPLPLILIKKLVKVRVKKNETREKLLSKNLKL